MIDQSFIKSTFDFLHANPEKSGQEKKTSEFLAEQLRLLSYEVTTNINGTYSVLGVLDSGVDGKVLGLRADFDALEFENDGKIECWHACGHDAHSTMVLTVAKMIAEEGIDKGKVYILFQAEEEVATGAKAMAESGLIDDMDEIIGMHIRPIEDTGFGRLSAALIHSSSAHVTAKIHGKSAHGARPHQGINAIDVGVQIISTINAYKGNPYVPHSAKVTKINSGGNSKNSIPNELTLTFDLRSAENDQMEQMHDFVLNTIESTAKNFGASSEILEDLGTPAPNYDENMMADARESIIEVVGEENLRSDLHTVGGEDFHYFSEILGCKSCYLALGADASPGLHFPKMEFNRDSMEIGVKVLFGLFHKRMQSE